MNLIHKFLAKENGMTTACCDTEFYAVVEKNIICMNPSCNDYLAVTSLKKNYTIPFSAQPVKTT